MKITLRKIRPGLFIHMDAKEEILAAGVDETGRFVVTSGWDGKISTIWHQNQLHGRCKSQRNVFDRAFVRAGIAKNP